MTTTVEPAATEAATPIADARERSVVTVSGRIGHIEISPLDGPARLVAAVEDGSGAVELVFMGRRLIPGIRAGQRLHAQGRLIIEDGARRVYNPRYELESAQ